MCSTLELAGNSVCYADRQQAPVFKTQKTWGHHSLSKQTGKEPSGRSIQRVLPVFPVKSLWLYLLRARPSQNCCAGGWEEQARLPLTPGFLVPCFMEYLLLEIWFICGCCSGLVSKRFYHPLRVLNVQTELTGNGFFVGFFCQRQIPALLQGAGAARGLCFALQRSCRHFGQGRARGGARM